MGGEGERLYAERRRRFWKLVAGLALIGLVTGLVASFILARDQAGGGAMPPAVATAGSVLVVVLGIAVAYGSWRFFVTVDEVELADNLWGSLVGFYAYAILFPAWWAMAKLGRASEPNDWIIYAVAFVAALAAYAYRKWRNR